MLMLDAKLEDIHSHQFPKTAKRTRFLVSSAPFWLPTN